MDHQRDSLACRVEILGRQGDAIRPGATRGGVLRLAQESFGAGQPGGGQAGSRQARHHVQARQRDVDRIDEDGIRRREHREHRRRPQDQRRDARPRAGRTRRGRSRRAPSHLSITTHSTAKGGKPRKPASGISKTFRPSKPGTVYTHFVRAQKFHVSQSAPQTRPARSVRRKGPASPASRSRRKLRRAWRRFQGSRRNTRLPQVSGKKTSGQSRGRTRQATPRAMTTFSLRGDQASGCTRTERGRPRFSSSSTVSRMPGSTLAKAITPPVQRTAREAGLIT